MRRTIWVALTCMACVLGFAQVQDELSARKLISKFEPDYPAMARASRISGIARLAVHVRSNGKVESVQVLGGHPLSAQAAVSAVSQ
jgi:outer membrane biosynthesis protein TonB